MIVQWSDSPDLRSDAALVGLTDELRWASALRPPVTGAWREGDPPGKRQFVELGAMTFEHGGSLGRVRVAYESWGKLSPTRDNVVLLFHALTGDSHASGPVEPGHPTPGWWQGMIGPGAPLDTERFCVVVPNVLGGCQGTTGPSSLGPDGREYGSRFPSITVRDQVAATARLLDALGVERVAAVMGASMGGMLALEWAIAVPDRCARLCLFSAPAASSALTIAQNTLQADAIRLDPAWSGGDYYDLPAGAGPHRGLALARRLAMLTYRSPHELNLRFGRSWQSRVSPEVGAGRYSVESYLDFHGNRFTRRFDANSYLCLLQSMNSHDVGRDRDGIDAALASITAETLVVGVDSDQLFPIAEQHAIAKLIRRSISGPTALVVSSPYGHDGFLIESAKIGAAIRRVLP